ncbi:histidine kinase famiy protein [Teichococcus vastitatis]|uniref:histidine kinase n=1 Tax=Teichococcus vastitatis TaxID=2307076 RepID=A0ABS9WC08_9PROT|nr:histidine kinase famiy protein [Pseudoroseomonas vastitatis]MCI0756843.1 histidine kinase famiy protein [Pseudoroseomonas vastitatis]
MSVSGDEAGRVRVEHPEEEDVQGEGWQQSRGVPAQGRVESDAESAAHSPTGGPGFRHWQEATVSDPGLGNRGSVFFAAVEMTRMPMILTNPNQHDNPIVFANRAFEDLTGYRQDEIIGRNCRFLQGAQTEREQVALLRRAVAAEEPISAEILNYKRDGTPFWNGVYIAPVYDDENRLIYFFASQLDVSRRRASEQAFRQAQKMESIGQLTAGLAHDFNNLLQSISGSLELLGRRTEDPTSLRYLSRAAEAADRGAKLTKQLLAFARKTRLDPRPTELNTLINEFGDMLESSVGNQVELRFNLQRRLPPAQLDPVHLEMALLNVVINARDAMPQGGTVTITTTVETLPDNGLPGGRYVVLSVADTGCGMPPHVLERATEPFFTTKGTGKGTGLGLAMALGFVQQSLGKLEIRSELGQGTTIRMLFPAAPEISTPPRPAAPRSQEIERRGAAETVLVVEDSEDVLALACEQLEDLGYRVLPAGNADEALAILDRQGADGIDLLFSDILMPGSMNGLMLAEIFRERAPHAAVLLTTGYNEDLTVQVPRSSSMDVLGKPYRRSELADRVRSALDGRGRERVPRAGAPRPNIGPEHQG